VNIPERMKIIIEWTGHCLIDVSEVHKIWLKKLPRVTGRPDPFMAVILRDMGSPQTEMPWK